MNPRVKTVHPNNDYTLSLIFENGENLPARGFDTKIAGMVTTKSASLRESLSELTCVLFDLDGTLIDTVKLIHQSFDYAVRTVLGQRLSQAELLRNMGRPLLIQMQGFSKSRAEELLEAYNKHNLSRHDQYISAYPGAVEAVEWLGKEKSFKLGIVTSKKRDLCLRGLELTGLREFFEVVVAMEDSTHHKPDPDPVLLALAKLEQRSENTVFIGDSPFDIEAGNKAGCITGAALWGPFSTEVLRERHPDFELRGFADLRAMLGDQTRA